MLRRSISVSNNRQNSTITWVSLPSSAKTSLAVEQNVNGGGLLSPPLMESPPPPGQQPHQTTASTVIRLAVLAVQWAVPHPQCVFRSGASMSTQLCLVYQHYWLQVMFWTESIWPLEGLKYIIVQGRPLETPGYTARAAVCLTLPLNWWSHLLESKNT